MTRSKRKTPIISNTLSGLYGSEKDDKRIANRDFRRTNKMLLRDQQMTKDLEDIILLYRIREVSDVWSFNKDGKHYFADADEEMRK